MGYAMISAILLVWNPKKYDWSSLARDLDTIRAPSELDCSWSVDNIRNIEAGSQFFLIRLGSVALPVNLDKIPDAKKETFIA